MKQPSNANRIAGGSLTIDGQTHTLSKNENVDDADWSVHYLVVGTKNWWPGKKVLISPRSATEIDWTNRLVHPDIDR